MNVTRQLAFPQTLCRRAALVNHSLPSRETIRMLGYGIPRHFSTTKSHHLKEFFPARSEAPQIRREETWPHPIYTKDQMESVKIAHRDAQDWSDWIALGSLRTLRWGMDLVTGYTHDDGRGHGGMTERKYMIRNIFLESVAGVPGMVAGMLRHLRSLRRMERDHGWIESLLEESFNERMHLLTFLKMAEPGWFMRLMVLGAQGVFFNAMFVAYLISPRICHRFVGYLEEEAVITYTRELADLDAGKLPKWEKMMAPDMAISYWKMPEGHRTMRDLFLYIRADESKHREVNHTLGNLNQEYDPNPYLAVYKDASKPHPVKGLEYQRPEGWPREEVL